MQNDIKRIIAYSTCSQLGYMFVAMGVGAYSVGMFHLFTHAFFKALLFLGSGSVILAMHHEQDIRKMGGLKDRIPFTYVDDGDRHAGAHRFPAHRRLFLQGRDHRGGLVGNNPMALYGFVCTVVAALLTVVLFLAADLQDLPRRAARPPALAATRMKARMVMLIPLVFLAPARSSPAFRSRICSPATASKLLPRVAEVRAGNHILEDMHHIAALDRAPADRDDGARLPGRVAVLHPPPRTCRSSSRASTTRSTASCSTSGTSTRSTTSSSCGRRSGSAALLWKGGDGWLIDGFGPDGVSARVLDVTRNVVRLQTGYLYHYAFAMLIGVAALHHLVHVRGEDALMIELADPLDHHLPAAARRAVHLLRARRRRGSRAATRAGSRCGRRSSPSRSR